MLALEQKVSSRGRTADQVAQRNSAPAHRRNAEPGPPRPQACACGGTCPRCQAKSRLTIGAPDDAYEQEADRVADAVMSGQHSAPNQHDFATELQGGSALPPSTRSFMKSRLGHNFSQARIHSSLAAEQSARDVNANAYTAGGNIVFGTVRTAPGTHEGRQFVQRESLNGYHGGGGQFGGGGATACWDESAAQRMYPTWSRMSLPSTLQFYHGTKWSIAQNIGRIEPRGIGDFAAGFYTHFEPENNPAALNRAKERGRWAARQDPPEAYAGVLNFQVPTNAFVNLLNTRSRVFPLRDRRQRDYAERQREWLDYIRAHGREASPHLFADRYNVERWRHLELSSPSVPSHALTIGPFYTPVPGLPGQPPPGSQFHPKSLEPETEPTRLQHQVAWANEGIDLLNASPRLILQFDRETGDPIVPPTPVTVAPPQASQHYTSQNPSDE